jgi:methyl-accepting chemotaxis protein
MNIDLTSAAMKHSTWKLRLRTFLDGKGGLTAEQATSHKECDLGKWLETEGLKKYAAIPEMKTLDREHQTLHRMIKTVIDFKSAGKLKEAEIALQKVTALSDSIVKLIHAIDAKTSANSGR